MDVEPGRPRFLWTAAEAFPVFEEAVLAARDHVRAGFRVFDPDTPLRSEAARAIGHDWFDLLVHVLSRGVRVTVILSDFDPVARPALHRGTWAAIRRLAGVAEASGRPDLLRALPAMHPARMGSVLQASAWPFLRRRLADRARSLNREDPELARETLREAPGLRGLLVGSVGKLVPRAWPPAEMVPASHHQKIVVIDDRITYLGGLDLNPRRYDTEDHDRSAEQTWHDVQVLIEDEDVARDAIRHLDGFLDVVAGRSAPGQGGAILRTLSAPRTGDATAMSPRNVVRELAEAHLEGIRDASGLIYLETQFLRERAMVRAMADAARADPDLRALIVLPAAPEDVAFDGNSGPDARFGEYLQARCVEIVSKAFGDRVFFMSPAQPRNGHSHGRDVLGGAPIVYLHAKVSIFGENAAIVSSANVNGRSLNWDTEAGLRFTDADDVLWLREGCMRHWLPADPDPDLMDPARAVASWRALAHANGECDPDDRAGFLLPYPVAPARLFGRNLPGVPEAMV